MGAAEDVISCARQWVGYSRWDDPEEGTVFGRWYAGKVGERYYGTSGVPYCAMFASYCLDWAEVEAPGFPLAYVPYAIDAAEEAERTVPVQSAEFGDLVTFDWQGDGVSDHIGFVIENDQDNGILRTIEGNTSDSNWSNGGCVAERTRYYSQVSCVIRPYYFDNEEEDMTDEQEDWLRTCYQQLTSKYDPTGRDVAMNDHDHIKWIAAKQAKMDEKLDAICEALKIDVG